MSVVETYGTIFPLL